MILLSAAAALTGLELHLGQSRIAALEGDGGRTPGGQCGLVRPHYTQIFNATGTIDHMNPFEATVVLGLDPFSGGASGDDVFSAREIEKAYRRQARKHHPDKNGGDVSSSAFLRLQTAKDVLLHQRAGETSPWAAAEATAAANPNSSCRIDLFTAGCF